MKSLEEVIKYKLDFLPIGINPFYAIQTYRARRGSNPTTTIYDIYETKEGIFSNDSFSLVEDITPLFIIFRAAINIIEKMVTEKFMR